MNGIEATHGATPSSSGSNGSINTSATTNSNESSTSRSMGSKTVLTTTSGSAASTSMGGHSSSPAQASRDVNNSHSRSTGFVPFNSSSPPESLTSSTKCDHNIDISAIINETVQQFVNVISPQILPHSSLPQRKNQSVRPGSIAHAKEQKKAGLTALGRESEKEWRVCVNN